MALRITKAIVSGSCTILSDTPMVCPLCGITTQPKVTHSCQRSISPAHIGHVASELLAPSGRTATRKSKR